MRRSVRMLPWGAALACALFLSPALPAQAEVHHVKADATGAACAARAGKIAMLKAIPKMPNGN